MRVGRRSGSISLAMGERRYWTEGGAFGWAFVRFWNGNGYGIFINLWDIVGLDSVVYEMSERKESNGA